MASREKQLTNPINHRKMDISIAKVILHVFGLPSFVLGIVSNWDNNIAKVLGVLGGIYLLLQILEKGEDYLAKRKKRIGRKK